MSSGDIDLDWLDNFLSGLNCPDLPSQEELQFYAESVVDAEDSEVEADSDSESFESLVEEPVEGNNMGAVFSSGRSVRDRKSSASSSSLGSIPSASASMDDDNEESGTTFECSVCLEKLDKPASIELPDEQNALEQLLRRGTLSAGDKRKRRGSGAVAGSSSGGQDLSIEERVEELRKRVVATQCGHLYHEVCVMQWFATNNGTNRCPTCRKYAPMSKLISIYGCNPYQTQKTVGGIAGTCDKGCRDLKRAYDSLKSEFSGLQQRYRDLKHETELKVGRLHTLREQNMRKDERIEQLKRELAKAKGRTGANRNTMDMEIDVGPFTSGTVQLSSTQHRGSKME